MFQNTLDSGDLQAFIREHQKRNGQSDLTGMGRVWELVEFVKADYEVRELDIYFSDDREMHMLRLGIPGTYFQRPFSVDGLIGFFEGLLCAKASISCKEVENLKQEMLEGNIESLN